MGGAKVGMLKVAAVYQDGWNSQAERDEIEDALVTGAPPTTQLILGYSDIDDLVQKVDLFLTIDPDKPCLAELEINAHGNPGLINDLSTTSAATWGTKLMALNWCDNAAIYLAGCNSGLALGPRFPAARRGPIAKDLADAMPFDPSSFAVHLLVHGSNGYLSGTHTVGNENTVTDFTETEWHFQLGWPPAWREITVWEPYNGAQNATGNGCWIPFKNGNW